MNELVFILTDLFAVGTAPTAAGLPHLASFERLLARASHEPLVGDWRAWLAQQYAPAVLRALSPAASVAATLGGGCGAPGTQYWLATPVHLFAGLDSVQLHPQGLLRLGEAEQAQLCADFARVFADSAWQLRSVGARELLLSGPALVAGGADPARFIGAQIAAGLPQGAQAATLRRLMTEIEMWLHEHPLNLARAARAQLAVSALWLWGHEAPRHVAAAASSPAVLWGEDTYAQALWRAQAAEAHAVLPERFTPALCAQQSALVLAATLEQPAQALAALERDWFEPALSALRTGRLARLQLLLGSQLYRLGRWQLCRVWRRPRPWWEALA